MSRIVSKMKLSSALHPYKLFDHYIKITPYTVGTGILCGGAYGSYSGFTTSKNDDIVTNLAITAGAGQLGLATGFFMGILWPITLPFIIARGSLHGVTSDFFEPVKKSIS